jgi:hypothetical protein
MATMSVSTPCQPGGAGQHDQDFAELDDADDPRLVAHVGQLPGERREDEEGQDEHGGSDGAELRLGTFRIVDAVDDEQHHGVLEQVVVEGAQQLRDEQRQEAALAHQVGCCRHAVLLAPFVPNVAGP